MAITVGGTTITFNDGTTQTTAASAVTLVDTTLFTSSSTWTCPAGVTKIRLSVVGGGGGAGRNYGRSGGFGGYADGVISVTPGTTYTVTVGAGGAGSTAGGSAGGESWFGVNSSSKLMSATGGAGGPNSAAYATNGNGTGGTLKNTCIGGAFGGTSIGTSSWVILGNREANIVGLSKNLGDFAEGSIITNYDTGATAKTYSLTSNYLPGAAGGYDVLSCSGYYPGGSAGCVVIRNQGA